jgi:hypothetical protein
MQIFVRSVNSCVRRFSPDNPTGRYKFDLSDSTDWQVAKRLVDMRIGEQIVVQMFLIIECIVSSPLSFRTTCVRGNVASTTGMSSSQHRRES